MKIVYCEPYAPAVVKEIEDNPPVETLQGLVDGYIECIYPYHKEVDCEIALVCNEEGKLMGLEPCRALFMPDGRPYDVIAGSFFLCKSGLEDFEGFTDEEAQKLVEIYSKPCILLSE